MSNNILLQNRVKPVFTIGRYFKNKFGVKVYKIPISIGGFTCPNIDGTVSKGGCTFCENDSFSPNLQKEKMRFKLHPNKKENPYLKQQLHQLEIQFNATKKRLENKFGAKAFIVYFQSFTNTYAPMDTLKALYTRALELDNVIGLSIGTRTDCVNDEILDYLVALSKDKEISIEYGIQSFYDKTLELINRGHDTASMKYWIKRTKEKGLQVCGHLIYGLPNETQSMMIESLKQTIALEVDSIKIHPLYVVKHTMLTREYNKGNFTPISEELYIDMVVKSIKMLPNSIYVQRVTAGINDSSLLSPDWCMNKHQQMLNIRKALLKEGLYY